MTDSPKIDVKVGARLATEAGFDLEAVIPIFHRWIRDEQLADLLIDVADYRHVHHGPGVILVGHDAQYGLDQAEGKLGLLYSRRRETHADLVALDDPLSRLRSSIERALTTCVALELEPEIAGKLRFEGGDLLLRYNDRLPGDGAAATLAEAAGAIADELYGAGEYELLSEDDHGRPTVRIQAADRLEVAALRSKLVQEVAA